NDQVRIRFKCRFNMANVSFYRLAFDRHDRNSPIGDERSRDVVLRRKRVGSDQQGIGPACLQRTGKIGSLRRDMSASNQLDSGQRFLGLKSLADKPKDGHLSISPLDPLLALRSKVDVFDIVFY